MVNSAWFFSTLAQSSAAILGFIIAFTAVLHQLDREQRERRSQDLRERLIEFKEEYFRATFSMYWLFLTTFDFLQLSEEADSILIAEGWGEYRAIRQVTEDFLRISNILASLGPSPDPKQDYLLTSDEFEEIETSINSIFDRLSEARSVHPLREEVADLFGITESEASANKIFGGHPTGPDNYEFPANSCEESEVLGEWFEERSEVDDRYSGQDIGSLFALMHLLNSDFQDVNAKKGNTWVDYEPTVRPMLRRSALLLVVGVFVPTLFLITPPIDGFVLGDRALFVIELSLVGVSAGLSLGLLRRLLWKLE